MNRERKIADKINSEVNIIVARLLIAVFVVILVVTILSLTGVFETTLSQMNILVLAGGPSALFGIFVVGSKRLQNAYWTKFILCALMCMQAFAVAMAAYAYAGTIILLLPLLLSAIYPKSKVCSVVAIIMLLCGFVIPPLALMMGLWDGGYYEFLYDLSYARRMDTSTLSNDILSQREQIICAIRYCSSQNLLIVGGFSVIGRRIHNLANRVFENQKEILRLSETDELTGLLNRNCYERRLDEMPVFNGKNSICFYFDVNGLHEMNNTKGHKAGDAMLQYIAKQVQNVFGEDNTFRVGGDEYVAFSRNMDPSKLSAVKKSLEEAFAAEGYHVAVGYALSQTQTDINGLVQEAEKEMYRAKSEYYAEHKREKR